MKGRSILVFLALGSLGLIGFTLVQAIMPASLKAERQAMELLSNIELVPVDEGGAAAAEDTSTDAPAETVTQLETQRNHYLTASLAAVERSLADLDCARANYFLDRAIEHQQTSGGSPEKWLLDQLKFISDELLMVSLDQGGFNGSPEHQNRGRSLQGDVEALLLALQWLYNGSDRQCISEPYLAGQQINNYLIRAGQYRTALEEEARRQISTKEAEVVSND